jgi:flagellar protein FlbD
MIQLTRLNNHPMALNSDLIKFVEQAPDTVITLVTGEKLVVRESAVEIIQRVVQFRREVLKSLGWEEKVFSRMPTPAPPIADSRDSEV